MSNQKAANLILCLVFTLGLATVSLAINPTGRPQTTSSSSLQQAVNVSRTYTSVNKYRTHTSQAKPPSKATQATTGIVGLNTGGIGGAVSEYSNDVLPSVGQSIIQVSPGQSAQVNVTANANSPNAPNTVMITASYSENSYYGDLSAYSQYYLNPNKYITASIVSGGVFVSTGESQARNIAVAANTPPGDYVVKFRAGWSGHYSINTADVTVRVVDNAPQVDSADVFAAPHSGNVDASLLSNGNQNVTGMFAVIDADFNGIVNSANSNNTQTAYPVLPSPAGGVSEGSGFANANGKQANILVAISINNNSQILALHIRDNGQGTVEMVQMIVWDTVTGLAAIQDVDFAYQHIDVTWPTANSPGSISGTVLAAPFWWDAGTNLIFGNDIDVSFNMALTVNE